MTDVEVIRDVPVPMRDGTTLRADIHQPVGDDVLPVLLMRTPYSKTHAESNVYAHPAWYAERGYLVVVQDVRGRGVSEGAFDPFVNEALDGYDSVEWAAALPRSNGRVAMYGFSYVGATQLLAASTSPPHLVCICPGHTSSDLYEGWTYKNGALQWAFVAYWSLYLSIDTAVRAQEFERAQELQMLLPQMPSKFSTLPLTQQDAVDPTLSPYFQEWLSHPTDGEYWRNRSSRTGWDVPTQSLAGWYDIFCDATFTTFQMLKDLGVPQNLVVGPWLHMPWSQTPGAVDFGPNGRNDVNDRQLQWLDYWCKQKPDNTDDTDNPVSNEPTIDYFVMGSNIWRRSKEWPPAETTEQTLFLTSDGIANSISGNGRLAHEVDYEKSVDRFLYNPRDPAPSLGGRSCCFPHISPMGVADQRASEIRNDVLVFTGAELTSPLTIAGSIKVTLFAATNGDDADWTAKLVDVHPDGKTVNVCEGIVRARYRDGKAEPHFVTQNEILDYQIELGNVAFTFHSGHRLRIDISSSNFPAYDRNPGNKNDPATAKWEEFQMTDQSVFHGRQFPSRVVLPILPEGHIPPANHGHS